MGRNRALEQRLFWVRGGSVPNLALIHIEWIQLGPDRLRWRALFPFDRVSLLPMACLVGITGFIYRGDTSMKAARLLVVPLYLATTGTLGGCRFAETYDPYRRSNESSPSSNSSSEDGAFASPDSPSSSDPSSAHGTRTNSTNAGDNDRSGTDTSLPSYGRQCPSGQEYDICTKRCYTPKPCTSTPCARTVC